ncbi:MAG TPA: hypothetical protein VGJ73_04430 [Verrucomicrobiae bacterium]
MKLLIVCLLALNTLLWAGCASSNVNPAVPRHDMAYVDFYAAGTNDLYWDVTDTTSNKKVFSEFRPLRESILRLAFKPGHYQFQVTFPNRVIAAAGMADVDVHNGMVTPVMVTLLPMDAVVVQSKTLEAGTSYARYRRRTKTSQTQTVNYKIITEPQPPLPYRRKELMPYFSPSSQ